MQNEKAFFRFRKIYAVAALQVIFFNCVFYNMLTKLTSLKPFLVLLRLLSNFELIFTFLRFLWMKINISEKKFRGSNNLYGFYLIRKSG